MAREWHLRGVNPEELVQKTESEVPQTPRDKWVNFWYHNKWTVLLVAAAVLIVTWLTVHTATREKPDYLICMVTGQEVSAEADRQLEELLAGYGTDRNGDGVVRVEVQCLNVAAGAANPLATTNQQTVMAHIMARDVSLWAVVPSYYTVTLHTAFDGRESEFFVPLNRLVETAEGVSKDAAYWDWTGAELTSEERFATLPKTLYWGVRALPENASDAQKRETADMVAFLEKFAGSVKFSAGE